MMINTILLFLAPQQLLNIINAIWLVCICSAVGLHLLLESVPAVHMVDDTHRVRLVFTMDCCDKGVDCAPRCVLTCKCLVI